MIVILIISGVADRQGGKKGHGVSSRNAQKNGTANNLLRGIHQVLSFEKVSRPMS